MKHLFILALLCLSINRVGAQTEILDAKLQITQQGTQATGIVFVYLSEATALSALTVSVGSAPETNNLYNSQLGLTSGGSFWSQGTLQDGVLTLPLGILTNQQDYYTTISIQLTDNSVQTIAVHTPH